MMSVHTTHHAPCRSGSNLQVKQTNLVKAGQTKKFFGLTRLAALTATSRLRKAVTSHRTPKAIFGQDGVECGDLSPLLARVTCHPRPGALPMNPSNEVDSSPQPSPRSRRRGRRTNASWFKGSMRDVSVRRILTRRLRNCHKRIAVTEPFSHTRSLAVTCVHVLKSFPG